MISRERVHIESPSALPKMTSHHRAARHMVLAGSKRWFTGACCTTAQVDPRQASGGLNWEVDT